MLTYMSEGGKVVERKKELDNMTGQELKEMITNQKIKLEDLDIEKLNRLFEYESTVICNSEGDSELLLRCADLLAEKEGFAEEHDQKFQEMLQAAMHNVPVTARRRKRYGFKKALLIAAAVALLVGSLSVVAVAFGCDIFAYFREIITRPAGATMEKDAVTLIHNGEATEYSSIEELLKTIEVDIMYPAKLPDGISVTTVDIFAGVNAEEMVCIKTTDPQMIFFVQLKAIDTGGSHKDCEIITKKGRTFYIRKDLNFAFSYFAGNYYSFQAGNYEQLQYILDNLEE